MTPRILFIITPDRDGFSNKIRPNRSPQIGVAYLAAYLKKFNIASRVLDTGFDFHNRYHDLKQAIDGFKPDLIGITLYSRLADYAKLIIEDIKKLTAIPIVAGGPHISSTDDEFFHEAPIDYGIKMDGEIPLKKLIFSLFLQEGELSSIPGLIYRNKDRTITINSNSELITDLDELPTPDFSGFKMGKYISDSNPSIQMITSRGCPYSCTFCNAHNVTGRQFRFFSARRVINDIRQYYEDGYRIICIGDDCFNVDLNRAKTILQAIIEQKMKIVLRFIVGIRANFGDQEFFNLLYQAGCRQIGFGLEAGDPDVLKSIKKGITIERFIETLVYARKSGLITTANFIIGHPNETYEQAQKSLQLARSLPVDEVCFFSMFPYKGTEAYNELKLLEKAGRIKFLFNYNDYHNKSGANIIWPVYESAEFTKKQRIKLLRQGRNLQVKTIFSSRYGKTLGFIFSVIFCTNFLYQTANRLRESRIGNYINRRINKVFQHIN